MAQPAKHTPGPWAVEQCSVPVLIAAAPAMYEALQEALKCIEKHVPKTEFAPRQWIREVLAQAERRHHT